MKQRSSHFFCHKNNCRKTCWETPEHVAKDALLITEVARIIEQGDGEGLFNYLNQGKGENNKAFIFFNRVIGWPEGNNYFMYGTDRVRSYYIGNMKRHDLARIKVFLDSVIAQKQS